MTREEAIQYIDGLHVVPCEQLKEFCDERNEAIDIAIEALSVANLKEEFESADAVKVAYICDGRKCDKDCSECFRTLDIEHARDFKRMGDAYYQQESADGEWIEKYNGNGWNDFWDYTCSNCGKKYERADAVLYHANYCPNCGAKMCKGGDDE